CRARCGCAGGWASTRSARRRRTAASARGARGWTSSRAKPISSTATCSPMAADPVPPMSAVDTPQSQAIALITGYYAAFNRGDWRGMLSLLADDVVHDLNQGPRETGRDAFAAFLQRMDRCYREQLRDIVVLASTDG